MTELSISGDRDYFLSHTKKQLHIGMFCEAFCQEHPGPWHVYYDRAGFSKTCVNWSTYGKDLKYFEDMVLRMARAVGRPPDDTKVSVNSEKSGEMQAIWEMRNFSIHVYVRSGQCLVHPKDNHREAEPTVSYSEAKFDPHPDCVDAMEHLLDIEV